MPTKCLIHPDNLLLCTVSVCL